MFHFVSRLLRILNILEIASGFLDPFVSSQIYLLFTIGSVTIEQEAVMVLYRPGDSDTLTIPGIGITWEIVPHPSTCICAVKSNM